MAFTKSDITGPCFRFRIYPLGSFLNSHHKRLVIFGSTFATTLRRLRHTAGLTQEDVADILDVSRAAIAQWETGRGTPLTRRLPDLAAIPNTSIQKLFEE